VIVLSDSNTMTAVGFSIADNTRLTLNIFNAPVKKVDLQVMAETAGGVPIIGARLKMNGTTYATPWVVRTDAGKYDMIAPS